MKILIHKLEEIWRIHSYQKTIPVINIIGWPLAWLYRLGSNLKRIFFWRLPGMRIKVLNRVISVGNLSVGGSGKTPVIKYCLELLKDYPICLISRGYGADFEGQFARYDGSQRSWDRLGKFGDEVHEVLRLYPNIYAAVGKQRAILAREQQDQDSERILLCDDAMQYWRLFRDLELVVIHGQKWLGNQRYFPCGPLREGPQALQRADAVIITNPQHELNVYRNRLESLNYNGPLFVLKTELQLCCSEGTIHAPDGQKLLAVTGIAFPDNFYDDLQSLGVHLISTKSYPDHYQFTLADMRELRELYHHSDASAIVITEKDFSRWPGISDIPLLVARQKLHCEHSAEFRRLLLQSKS